MNILFSQFSLARTHKSNVHEGKRAYSCTVCPATFQSKKRLTDHFSSVHEGKKPEKPHKCDICDTKFCESNALKHHVFSVHEEKRPHTCQICDGSFPSKGGLNVHI